MGNKKQFEHLRRLKKTIGNTFI